MGIDALKPKQSTETAVEGTDSMDAEYQRIKLECEKLRPMLQQACEQAETPDELKMAVKLASVKSDEKRFTEGSGRYITSSVNEALVSVNRVYAAIDQYASRQRWVGYGGDIPPYVGEKLEDLFGPVKSE